MWTILNHNSAPVRNRVSTPLRQPCGASAKPEKEESVDARKKKIQLYYTDFVDCNHFNPGS